MTATVQVITARDIVTGLGTIAAGTVMPAVATVDGGWHLELSLPLFGVPPHPVMVSGRKARRLSRWGFANPELAA